MKIPKKVTVKKHILKAFPFAKNSSISWEEFVEIAVLASKKYHFIPKITVCQAALETGRGSSLMCRTKNNYFGFMAYDEDVNQARIYPTALDSILDYLELITGDLRYKMAMSKKDPSEIITAIHEAGYATDPDYVKKITSMREWGEDYS